MNNKNISNLYYIKDSIKMYGVHRQLHTQWA